MNNLSFMSVEIACGKCGEKITSMKMLKSLKDVMNHYNGKCPSCGQQLSTSEFALDAKEKWSNSFRKMILTDLKILISKKWSKLISKWLNSFLKYDLNWIWLNQILLKKWSQLI